MFKCSAMASTCGGCRRTDPVYNCGWDADDSRCCAFNECAAPSDDICDNPALFTVRHNNTLLWQISSVKLIEETYAEETCTRNLNWHTWPKLCSLIGRLCRNLHWIELHSVWCRFLVPDPFKHNWTAQLWSRALVQVSGTSFLNVYLPYNFSIIASCCSERT